MANLCSNYITFSGDVQNCKKFINAIKALKRKSDKLNEGVYPFGKTDLHCLFDIEIDSIECYSFCFMTKWSPANDSLQYLSSKYNVVIENEYEELGCNVFGKFSCEGDYVLDEFLGDADFNKYTEDEETGVYMLNGVGYDCLSDLLADLLNEKINAA